MRGYASYTECLADAKKNRQEQVGLINDLDKLKSAIQFRIEDHYKSVEFADDVIDALETDVDESLAHDITEY